MHSIPRSAAEPSSTGSAPRCASMGWVRCTTSSRITSPCSAPTTPGGRTSCGTAARRLTQASSTSIGTGCATSCTAGCWCPSWANRTAWYSSAASSDALDKLLSAQVFRLASWRMAADDINYRRFFDINELAALRVEEPAVFEATHRLLFELVASGQVNGVRIDHPDGLYDPAEYFSRLQRGAAERLIASTAGAGKAAPPEGALPLYMVAEKILAAFEQLPAAW